MVQSFADQQALLRTIARREPILFAHEEKFASKIGETRMRVRQGGYAYMPLLAHPLPVGKEKQENDLAMKRLRLMPIPKRIEAAVLQNKPWCVEELYLQGCPPDEPNRMGYRPLHLAASYNYEECVKVLLHMKMDVELNSTTSNGYTPLYIASSTRAMASYKMIQEAGGQADMTKNYSGYRSILDINIRQPGAVPRRNRAPDDLARNLGRPSYFGQY
mmetsp:Transcript_95054/g.271806  ORF Transcript_95054/g.271806 Transcript_95054/m.271806 type:complete len:217 (-) Transcript_95054:28-678(-)